MSRFYDRIFNIVAMIAVSMLMIPLFLIFLGGTIPHATVVLSAAAILSTALGYGLQWLFAAVTHKSASKDGYTDLRSGVFGTFHFVYAAVPLFVIALFTVGAFFLFDRYMQSLNGTVLPDGRLFYYTILYPIFFAVLFFAAATVGCVIWFYPIERLANIYLLIGGCTVFFIESIALSVSARAIRETGGTSFAAASLGLPFAVFFVCVLVIYNQSNLQKKYRGSVVSVISSGERRYNLFLVLLLLLAFVAATGVMYVIVAGISILVRMILFILLYRFFHRSSSDPSSMDYEYVDPDEAGRMFERNVMSPENQYLIACFVLMILGAVALYLLMRSGLLKRFILWLREVLDTILIGAGIIKVSFDPNKEEEDSLNYKDEVKKLQNAGIRDYRAMAESTDSYRLFLTRLGRLKTYDEQLCYAYAVLLKMYRKMNVALKTSDTPRQVQGKVERALTQAEIEQITKDFERVRYASEEPDDTEAAMILNNICSTVKRYMY